MDIATVDELLARKAVTRELGTGPLPVPVGNLIGGSPPLQVPQIRARFAVIAQFRNWYVQSPRNFFQDIERRNQLFVFQVRDVRGWEASAPFNLFR